jgi:PAS domain S-box-containing protein
MWDFISEESKATVKLILENGWQGINESLEIELICKDGSFLWSQVNAKSLFDKYGKFIGIMTMHTDITKRKNMEKALLKSEEKYRNIVETSNEGISLNNNDGLLTYVNQKMAEMIGYDAHEIIGRNLLKLVDDIDYSIALDNMQKQFQNDIQSYDFKLLRKDGFPLWVFVNIKSFFDDNGKFTGSLNMFTDITERKKAEIKLKETLDNLENLIEERTAELETTFRSFIESERGLAEAQKMAHIGNWN